MFNRVHRLGLVALLALALTAGVLAQRLNIEQSEPTSSGDSLSVWRLPSGSADDLKSDVVAWANAHFGSSQVIGPIEQDGLEPVLPFSYVSNVEFEIVHVPGKLISSLQGRRIPTYHSDCVLRDARGVIYTATIESYDARRRRFEVRSIGPALDRSRERYSLTAAQRMLKQWPPPNRRGRSDEPRKLVFLPYPFAADQTYYQFGNDVDSATFEDLHTGETYTGLETIVKRADEDRDK